MNLFLNDDDSQSPTLRNITRVLMALVVENWCGAAVTIVGIGAGRGWEGEGAPLSVSFLR